GQRGARVQAVVAELGGEKIDVIPWNDDAGVFVANALSPAQVISVDIDEEKRIANVTVPERMLSLAIGREGQNARLAARLTGWRIDIRSDVSVAEAKAAEEAKAETPAPKAESNRSSKAAAKVEADGATAPEADAEAAPEAAPEGDADATPAKPARTTRTRKTAAAKAEPEPATPAEETEATPEATEPVAVPVGAAAGDSSVNGTAKPRARRTKA